MFSFSIHINTMKRLFTLHRLPQTLAIPKLLSSLL